MTEIEKMYKLAKVKATNIAEYGSTYIPNSVKIDDELYPSFTTEKQLKITEWFISNRLWLNLKSLDRTLDFSLDFDEKLAKLVNRLWESFYEEEKEEIRNILNG